jgi:hypothetical protein
MAGSYCYYPVSAPPPAMSGYGWVEIVGVLAQVGATIYGIDAQKRIAAQAQHAQERAIAAAAEQQAAAQQYAQQQAVVAMQNATAGGAPAGGGVAAQLGAVPTWVWGVGALGAAVIAWKVARR